MATFSVHARDGDNTNPVEDVIFVRDGFSVKAVIFGGLWFLWHRMWLTFFGYAIVALALVAALASGMLHPLGASMLQSLLAVTVGLQAAALRRHHVERAGFHEVAVVSAANRDDAELRYFLQTA